MAILHTERRGAAKIEQSDRRGWIVTIQAELVGHADSQGEAVAVADLAIAERACWDAAQQRFGPSAVEEALKRRARRSMDEIDTIILDSHDPALYAQWHAARARREALRVDAR